MKVGKLIVGILFLVLGIILLGQTLGLYSMIPLIRLFTLWPVGLIMVGVCLVARQKGLAFAFLAITGIMLTLNIVSHFILIEASNPFDFEEVSDPSIATTDVNIEFGVGTVFVHKGDSLMKFYGNSSFNDPDVDVNKDDDVATIDISRSDDGNFQDGIREYWNIGLEKMSTLDIDYGLADVEIDLRGLETDEIDLDFGVSNTKVIFARYPTKATFDCGVSDISLVFPEGYGVKVIADVGLSKVDLKGMQREGNTYFKNYDSEGEYIEVILQSGVSNIRGEFK